MAMIFILPPQAGLVVVADRRRFDVAVGELDVVTNFAIATARPSDLSILNVFAGRVAEMHPSGAAAMDLQLDIGVKLWARITARSVHDLGLVPGREVYALIKSVAIDRHSLGLAEPPKRD